MMTIMDRSMLLDTIQLTGRRNSSIKSLCRRSITWEKSDVTSIFVDQVPGSSAFAADVSDNVSKAGMK